MGGDERGVIAPAAGVVFCIFFIDLLQFWGDGAMIFFLFGKKQYLAPSPFFAPPSEKKK